MAAKEFVGVWGWGFHGGLEQRKTSREPMELYWNFKYWREFMVFKTNMQTDTETQLCVVSGNTCMQRQVHSESSLCADSVSANSPTC